MVKGALTHIRTGVGQTPYLRFTAYEARLAAEDGSEQIVPAVGLGWGAQSRHVVAWTLILSGVVAALGAILASRTANNLVEPRLPGRWLTNDAHEEV